MLRKTVKEYRRMCKTRNYGIANSRHIERVMKETWWLLWIIPMYSRETITATNI